MNAYEGEARRARTRFSPQIDCDASPNTVLLHRREGESPIHGIWVTWLFLAARDAPHSKKLFDASARIGRWLPLLVALLTDVRETPVSRWPPSLPLRSPCRCATRERAARHTRARRVRLIRRCSLARLAPTAVPDPNAPLTSSSPRSKTPTQTARARPVAARRSSFAGAAVRCARVPQIAASRTADTYLARSRVSQPSTRSFLDA